MATLNVKNLSEGLYKKLQKRARTHRRSVAQEVTFILESAVEEPVPLSILELQGLGKDVWKGVDAKVYVEAERKAWD